MISRLKYAKRALTFWCLFIGIGAVWGSSMMFIDPSGKLFKMDDFIPYFQVLPFANILFQNLIFSGISLLIVNGISNLLAAFFLFKKKKVGYYLGTIFGITLMLWITIQFVIFPPNFLSILYFIFGILQAITGYCCIVFYHQENFHFDIKEYSNIDKNADVIVVYFSRLSYSKKIAYEIANKEGAFIEEVKTTEKTTGTSGFWWCGRFAMHRWGMKISTLNNDIKKFKKVIIVTPIWIFKICSPIRQFIMNYQTELQNKEVTMVFNHFNSYLPKGAIKEVNKLINCNDICSYTTKLGKIKKLS